MALALELLVSIVFLLARNRMTVIFPEVESRSVAVFVLDSTTQARHSTHPGPTNVSWKDFQCFVYNWNNNISCYSELQILAAIIAIIIIIIIISTFCLK